jgi:hypothetical protein
LEVASKWNAPEEAEGVGEQPQELPISDSRNVCQMQAMEHTSEKRVTHVERPTEGGMEDMEDVEDEGLQGIGRNEAVVRAQDAALVVAPRFDQDDAPLK